MERPHIDGLAEYNAMRTLQHNNPKLIYQLSRTF
jgi:hypothetical protein